MQYRAPPTVAFGKAHRTGSARAGGAHTGSDEQPIDQSTLTSQNITSFDRKSGSIGVKRQVNPEVVVFTGEEVKIPAQAPASNPNHKNYGKVPKYLNKYKEEAVDLAKKREEIRAKKLLPAGMMQMPEAERI